MSKQKPYIFLLMALQLFAFHVYATNFTEKPGCSPFADYDEFIDFLSSKNFFTPSLFFKWKFPRSQFDAFQHGIDCSVIKYKVDEIQVTGFFLKPRGELQRKYPLIVFNRGGNGSFGAINFVTLMEYLKPLVDEGFAVVASQYRGHMRKQPDKYGKDEFGGRDVQDVHALIDIAKSREDVESNSIFMYGVSRGGMMSYLVSRQRNDIRAMAIHAGATDLKADLSFRPEMENVYRALIPNYDSAADEELIKRSVMYWVEEIPEDLPILLVHGKEDERVSARNALDLYAKLKTMQRPVELSLYEDEGHMFTDKSMQLKEVTDWFHSVSKQSK